MKNNYKLESNDIIKLDSVFNDINSQIKNILSGSNWNSLTNSQIQKLISIYSNLYYTKLFSDYPNYKPEIMVEFEKIKDNDVPAQCISDHSHTYVLRFDIDKIKRKWQNHISYMVLHELIHVLENEINFDHPDNSSGGHNKVFIELVNKYISELSFEDRCLFLNRHMTQFLNRKS